MPPDIRFLLACLRGERASADLTTPAMFARLLAHHRVAPLVDAASIGDPALMAVLAEEKRKATMRAMEAVAVQAEVTARLRGDGLEPIWLKGPALASQLRGDAFSRPSRDLDLWIEEDALPAALRSLDAAGWHAGEAPRLDRLKRTEHAVSLHRADRRCLIELHWRFATPDRSMPLAGLQPRRHARAITVAGQQVTALSLEASLPYLAHHGCNHFWNRLFWLTDFQAAAARAIDWNETIAIAGATGTLRRLCLAFLAAGHLLGAPVPAPLQRAMPPSWKPERHLGLLAEAFPVPPEIDMATMYRVGLWRYVAWELALQDGWTGRAALIGQRLRATGKDELLLDGRAWMTPFLPLLRLLRIGSRALRDSRGKR